MTTRVDVHRPSVIEPDEYQFVAYEHLGGGMADIEIIAENRRLIAEHMAQTGGTYSSHQHGGNCHICGAMRFTPRYFITGQRTVISGPAPIVPKSSAHAAQKRSAARSRAASKQPRARKRLQPSRTIFTSSLVGALKPFFVSSPFKVQYTIRLSGSAA
jgi:hypothetical protein